MTRLRYYTAEEERWPILHTIKLTEQEAKVAVRRLWRFCASKEGSNQPQPRLSFTSGQRYSTANLYSIVLNRDLLTWLLVAHEVAHSWDLIRPGGAERPRWHDKHHRRLVDRLCNQIVKRGWMSGSLRGPDLTQKRAQAAQERRAARQAPEARIERRRAQVERLERKIKPLVTRLATARRSLGSTGARPGPPRQEGNAMTPCCEFHERGGPRRAPCREVEHTCDGTVPVCTCGRRWEWQSNAPDEAPRYTSDAVAQKYLALYGPLPACWKRIA